jgi:hypothetical protein
MLFGVVWDVNCAVTENDIIIRNAFYVPPKASALIPFFSVAATSANADKL